MNPVPVTKASLTANTVTLTVAYLDSLRVGYQVQVQGIGNNAYDGVYVLTAVTTNPTTGVVTVQYAKNHANIAEATVDGRITPVCNWIGTTDVEAFLGFVPDSEADTAWLEVCTATANDFCSRRRWENGYDDLLNTPPTTAAFTATVLYAGSMFRERGSVDSFSSFSEMPLGGTLAGNMGQITRLLGLMKPRVA